jgi:hypothetical protein
MKLNWTAYFVLAVVFLLSISAYFLVADSHNVLAGFVAAPGVTALFGALFQLARDESDYQKRLETQRRDFQFTLGAASHMANAAFDKHAEFGEKYMRELNETVLTLFREGDTPDALKHAAQLYKLRQDYAMWLTEKIDTDLDQFESTLRRLGADAQFIRSTTGHGAYSDERSLRINSNFELFGRILGLKSPESIEEKSLVDALKTRVRAILGIEELTQLREHLVKQASNAICS